MEQEMLSMMQDYASTAVDSAEVAKLGSSLFGMAASMIMGMMMFAFAIGIIMIIADWKIFSKAGEKGWKSLIPIYNTIVLFKIAGITPWLILGYFAAVIPGIGALVCLGITIYAYAKLAQAFGQGVGFTIGLILLNPIFILILAFGKAEYQLNK